MSTTIETTLSEPQVVEEREGLRREALLRAAELIEENGWTVGGTGMSAVGPYCFLGALSVALTEKGEPITRYEGHFPSYLEGSAHRWFSFSLDAHRDPAVWNDRHALSGEQVSRVLREMANGASFAKASGWGA